VGTGRTTAQIRTLLPRPVFRLVTADPERLAAIQEAASVAALAHVYGDEPFPREAVLERWPLDVGYSLEL
jgi:hypothetical protein